MSMTSAGNAGNDKDGPEGAVFALMKAIASSIIAKLIVEWISEWRKM